MYTKNERNPGEWRAASESPVEPGTDVFGAFVAVACVVGFVGFMVYAVWTAGTPVVDSRAASAAERSDR